MRLNEIKQVLKREKLDAIILFSKSPAFKYFIKEDFDKGILVLTQENNYLLVSRLYSPKFPGFKCIQYSKFKEDFEVFVKKLKIKKAGVDAQNIYLRQKKLISRYFKTKDVSSQINSLREVKTEEEMKRIRIACKITDEIFSLIIKNFKSFNTERDLVKFIKIEALKRDAEMAYEPIVASGKNAVVAHHNTASKINKGFMVLDFGAKYEGYCSDMTRTIYVGEPSREEIEIYSKILRVQESCLEKAEAGMKAGDIFNHSIKILGPDAKYFVHGLGHGFGVEIHEKPSLSFKSKDVLKKGTVVTIEPGYYNPKSGVGIRIEDDIYLGAKKEVLTKSTKNLLCLKK
jgi:Xaa-Pro aminopeptidase